MATGTGTVPAGINGWVTIDLMTHPNLSAGGYYWLEVNAQASGKSMRMYYENVLRSGNYEAISI
ncbi:MAG: hypothetical protein ABSG57_01940 [Candidatus Bathyarchaeia archaeon]